MAWDGLIFGLILSAVYFGASVAAYKIGHQQGRIDAAIEQFGRARDMDPGG